MKKHKEATIKVFQLDD